jgi:hypothetical protein
VREGAQTVVFGFGVGGGAVVEGWGVLVWDFLLVYGELRGSAKKRYGRLEKRALYL